MKSRPEGLRWVVNGVNLDTVRMVRELSVHHEVYMCQVIDEAVAQLYKALYDEGALPEGWREY